MLHPSLPHLRRMHLLVSNCVLLWQYAINYLFFFLLVKVPKFALVSRNHTQAFSLKRVWLFETLAVCLHLLQLKYLGTHSYKICN